MERLSDMLNAAQFNLVKKRFCNVSDDTMLMLIGRAGDSCTYREVGTMHRWQLDHNKDGFIVGVHRERNYFSTATA